MNWASIITQEDQCLDEETDHTIPERVFVMVVGEQTLQSSCVRCRAVFAPELTPFPTVSPTGSPTAPPTPVDVTAAPSRSPTSAPSSVPTTSPTSLPTRAPTTSPSVSSAVAPSAFPSEAPSIPVSCEGYDNVTTNVYDRILKEPREKIWLEGGFTVAGDAEWVSVPILLADFDDAVVF